MLSLSLSLNILHSTVIATGSDLPVRVWHCQDPVKGSKQQHVDFGVLTQISCRSREQDRNLSTFQCHLWSSVTSV